MMDENGHIALAEANGWWIDHVPSKFMVWAPWVKVHLSPRMWLVSLCERVTGALNVHAQRMELAETRIRDERVEARRLYAHAGYLLAHMSPYMTVVLEKDPVVICRLCENSDGHAYSCPFRTAKEGFAADGKADEIIRSMP